MALSILGQTSSNVGQILGDASKGVIKNLVIHGGAFSAAQTESATAIQAALAAASKVAKTDSGKLYWLPEVQNFEDRAEQNTTGALNLGPTVMLKEGKAGYEIKCDGSSEFAKAMRKWNNKTVGIYEYDSNRQLWGRQSGTDFKAYTAKIYVNAMRVASGQAPEEGIVTITVSYMSSTEYGDQAKCLDLSSVDISLISTQNDAELYEAAAKVNNMFKIGIGIPLGQHGKRFDVIAKFGAPLAAAANFEAKTGANFGTNLAVSTVAINAQGYLDVSVDNTAYTALAPGSKIQLNLKAPSVLEAAGITDIEGVAVIITK
jgi:hypothetical protein